MTTARGSVRYADLVANGLSCTHRQTIAWVPAGCRVLDIGCSTGYVGAELLAKGCRVTGVEPDPESAAEARARGLEVILGSYTEIPVQRAAGGGYDRVLLNDVLEHVVEPAVLLRAARDALAPGGRLVVSTPNIAAWSVRHRLFFEGTWRYEDTGIMDRTHVHFFTWETLHELLAEHGLTAEEVAFEEFDVPLWGTVARPLPRALRRWGSAAHRLGPLRAPVEWFTRTVAGALDSAAHRAGWALARRYPNLCAPHMALLVAPR